MEKLTVLLVKINNTLLFIFSKIIPNFIKESVELLQATIQHYIQYYKNKILKKLFTLKTASSPTEQPASPPPKKTKKLAQKTSLSSSLRTKIKSINPQYALGGSMMLAISIIASIQIYQHSQKIIEKMTDQTRAPASLRKMNRAVYFGIKRKHTQMSGLQIPIYYQKDTKKRVGSVQIDFVLETSNRYLKQYIENNDHEIRSRLHTNLAPMDPQFIQTDEGREIIKSKVRHELNELIREKKIKGKIQRVSVYNIIIGQLFIDHFTNLHLKIASAYKNEQSGVWQG